MDICILLVVTSPPAVSSTAGSAIVTCGAVAVATSAYTPIAASRNSPISTAAARRYMPLNGHTVGMVTTVCWTSHGGMNHTL
jgi:hypothetical protein